MSFESLTRTELLEKARELQEALDDAEAQNNSDRNATLDVASALGTELDAALALFSEIFGTHATETSDTRIDRLRTLLEDMRENVNRLSAP